MFGHAIRSNTRKKLIRNTQRTCKSNLNDGGTSGEVNHGTAQSRGGSPHRWEILAPQKAPYPSRGHNRFRVESPKPLNAAARALECSIEISSTTVLGYFFFSLSASMVKGKRGKKRVSLVI
jgi:hypothetical protein